MWPLARKEGRDRARVERDEKDEFREKEKDMDVRTEVGRHGERGRGARTQGKREE